MVHISVEAINQQLYKCHIICVRIWTWPSCIL